MPRTKKSGATNTESQSKFNKSSIQLTTFSDNSQVLQVVELDNEYRVKSTEIAEQLGLDHESLSANISRYEVNLKSFGLVRFEIGAKNKKTYFLNEDQALLIGTLSRNTEQVVKFKMVLVKAFSEARNKNKPQSTLDLLKLAISEIEAKDKIIELQKPAVEFHSQVQSSINSITVEQFAKALGTGRNRFFAWLKEQGYLIDSQRPYQEFIDRGYFKVVEKTRKSNITEESITYFQVLVTGKGQTFLAGKYNNQLLELA